MTTSQDEYRERRLAHHADHRVDLVDLLTEVRALLTSDTAVLLLVDSSGTVLVPAASVGIARAGRTGMRIRVGAGFAGGIASHRRPRIIAGVTRHNVVNPQLVDEGLQTLLGVPVLLDGRLLGVLHVGSFAERLYSERDVQLLVNAAERVATAVHDRRTTDEHTAALVMQRSLLPDALPDTAGLDLAARYIPADGDFGGDWYDVFELPGGRVGVVMGDVIGHGLRAAVVMGRLRSALRAYALEHDDPAEVLAHLDRKISHFERDAFTTVAYGVSRAPFDEFVISSAGHPAPLLLEPHRAARQLEIRADPPLAVAPHVRRRSTVVPLGVGAILCLFSDGLVERRPDGSDGHQHQSGVELALASLDQGTPRRRASAELTCSAIIDATLGDAPTEDDVALLVIRRSA